MVGWGRTWDRCKNHSGWPGRGYSGCRATNWEAFVGVQVRDDGTFDQDGTGHSKK